MTTAQDGGKVVNSLTHRPPLPPGNTPGTLNDKHKPMHFTFNNILI